MNVPVNSVERFAVLSSALSALRQELSDVKAALATAQQQARPPKLLLSLRAAAAKLGVDRQKVLGRLVREGRIHTVLVNGRVRIPLAEVERLGREGFENKPDHRRRRPAASPDRAPGDAIRALEL